MKKIQVKGNNVLYFDHRKLIAEAYKANDETGYTLRSQLFKFRPKKLNDDSISNETSHRKRKKRKLEICDAGESNTEEDLFLQQACEALKLEIKLLTEDISETVMTRFWESLNTGDFPKFKGANNTTNFQTIDKLVKGTTFLIPPGSTFFNYDIAELPNHLHEFSKPFDLIVLDPPWRNKYIRRLKRHQLGYNMLDINQLESLPIQELVHQHSIVAIWCTNSKQHQTALLEQLIPKWKLRPLHIFKWLKLNTAGEPIHSLRTETEHQKQPFEMLFIACHKNAPQDFGKHINEVKLIMSIPSIIHSHKPPLLEWYQAYFPSSEIPKCLELFARYLQPHFTSFGLEVFKLMDKRLYESIL